MFREYTTAPVSGLADFKFTQVRVAVFRSTTTVTHGWVHIPTGDFAGGFTTKRDAIASARKYRDALKAEAR